MICNRCNKDLKRVDYRRPDVNGGVCSNCKRLWLNENRPGYKDKIKNKGLKYRLANLDKERARKAIWNRLHPGYYSGWSLKNPDKVRNISLKNTILLWTNTIAS